MADTKRPVSEVFFGLSVLAAVTGAGAAAWGDGDVTGAAVVILCVALALACMSHAALRRFAFTLWVLVFVAASMFFPAAFGTWFGRDLAILIVPLIQIIMFGMGTTLSGQDFARVLAMPWPVFVGMALQFTVMPLVGLSIAVVFGFPPEIAAGVVLVGSVPGGSSRTAARLHRGRGRSIPRSLAVQADHVPPPVREHAATANSSRSDLTNFAVGFNPRSSFAPKGP